MPKPTREDLARLRLAVAQLAPGTKKWIASPITLIAAIAKQIDVKNAVAITYAWVLGSGLSYYNTVVDLHVRPASIVHWIGTDSMLLVYCAAWVLVPGALIGFAYALARPRSREQDAFGGVVAGLLLILFGETSMYASNGSPRFQERYFMGLLPLVLPLFGLYLKRGRPARLATCLLAVALLAVSARLPLAPYSIANNKQDSPFLLGVFRLEHALDVANGSLAIAVVAALLSALAAAIAWRARLAVVAPAFSLALAVAASAGSVSFDRNTADTIRADFLPAEASWIDHSGLRHVLLIHTPATLHARSLEQLFWNRSIDDVLYYGRPPRSTPSATGASWPLPTAGWSAAGRRFARRF